jgi:glycosyltransferase involved in cell wall biosynthesis
MVWREMPTVVHYLERWLELSAGFVAAQVSRSRYDGVVISRDGWTCLDAFPYQPRHSLHLVRDRTPERWKADVLRWQLRRLMRTTHADLVHVHFGYPASDVLSIAGPRHPYVLSLHGHDITGLIAGEPHRYAAVAPAVDRVIVPSHFLGAKAAAAGFDPDRIAVIPSGVDTHFFTPTPLPDDPPVVAFVGRLVAKKGLDVLLAAWPDIVAEVADASLVVLGDGPQAHLLEEAAASVTHVRPRPADRHEQVRDLIRWATVVASPSRTADDGDSDSLLLVNLEAGASGRPVVSTQHGGIPEYVADNTTGLLVPEDDSAALAAAVVRILKDRREAERLATNAVSHVAQWDVERCAARVDDCYDELLDRRK